MIYLDSAATTKPHKEVVEVIEKYLKESWFNPSSLYSPSVRVKEDIESAIKTVANFIGAKPNEIYFTSGGSESNCWAIQGFINGCRAINEKYCVITTAIEHKSIMDCVKNVAENFIFVDVDKYGFVNLDSLRTALESTENINNVLVSIQFANNEIGTIQNMKKISELCNDYGAFLHTDAVQAFGKIPINVEELDVDMLSASGHKIGCPKGIGFLYIKDYIKDDINPLIYGSQMDGMRGGTENVPYIMGFKKAVEIINDNDEFGFGSYVRKYSIRNYFLNKLNSEFDIKLNGVLVYNGTQSYRLPNNINITFEDNVNAESLIYMLDMSGIYISSGSACNAHSIKPSHVLKAIGLTDDEAMKTIRITLPDDITYEEIDKAVEEIEKCVKILLDNI